MSIINRRQSVYLCKFKIGDGKKCKHKNYSKKKQHPIHTVLMYIYLSYIMWLECKFRQ